MLHNNRLFAVAAILGLLIATVLGSGPGMAQAAPGAPAPAATTPVAPAAGCGMNFADVPAASWFYPFVEYLYCSHAVSGYGSEFRPNATTTRAQLTKMIGNALGWPLTYSGAPHFADVPPAQPFYQTIEAAYAHGIISGYQCGGPGEPCPGTYFRPGADVTRAQLAKMIILAQGWDAANPAQPSFSDVPPGAWYAGYVEAANLQGVVSGYADGTFRPFASATRAQLAKMIYNTLTPPAFDQGDDESEIQPQDDVSEETPEDLDPGPDGGPGLALPGEAGKAPSAPATATISGTITSTNTGSPLVGARVVAHPVGGGADVETTTGAAGAYTLAVPAGSYNVVAAAPEQMYPVTLAPGGPVTLADGGGATVSFALTQGGVLAGTITDSTTHAPIQGADEWAVPVALPPRAYGGTLSDGQGRYRLVVPAGPVGAWAAKPSDTYPRTPPSGGNPI
ncbi:MAG TPA: S-layer homology domain-containing protein, partial [Chloroflexia bacterium]|nr:S-layer homology domain-containing protein [Chloroflexia bacterium]